MLGVFIIGLVVGFALFAFNSWVRSNGRNITWYELVLGILGFLLTGFAIWNYFGSLAENYPKAGLMAFVMIGIPGLLLIAVAISLIFRRRPASGNN
ncbi:reductive dehalogenase membrane anchor [Dehalogenimonas formicexedens]|uniref:Reductive dehalogenase membrane anchor n=1 Tax=Dehalogenimonas formicexedens TaxID=1839801 RepID=A0A1P8F5H5_9CHLR|nr:hypothetical protein [Dehalogenimonas formicexedens]APV43729.1 reductive dehalogenase membrane anchor [Dehalogenimonas formicexedens]